MKIHQTASATELVRNLPAIQETLDHGPVAITKHGRTEFVMLSKDEYDRFATLNTTDADKLDTKLRLVLDTTSTMIVVTDEELRVRRANRAVCNYFGMSAADMVGRKLLEISDLPTFRFISSRAKHVLATGQEDSFELASSVRNDRLISFRMLSWPQGLAIFGDDITDRAKETDRFLRDTAFDTAMQAMADCAVGSIDKSGLIDFATNSFADYVGISREDIDGANFLMMLHPSDRDEVREFFRTAESKTKFFDVRFLRGGAEAIGSRVSFSPFPNTRGTFSFAFVVREL